MKNKTPFTLSVNETNQAEVQAFDFRLTANQMRPFLNDQGQTCIFNDRGDVIQVNHLNVNNTLPYDSWKDIDHAVLTESRQRLVMIQDLIDRGLVHNAGHIGNTVSQWQKSSAMTAAKVSMLGESESEKDRQEMTIDSVSLPIIHKDFSIPYRARLAAQMAGASLDVSGVIEATQVVAEASEDLAVSGSSVNVGGNLIYGYTTHPDRNTVTLATAWTSITDYQDILDDVIAMANANRADGFHGPYTLYIPTAYEGIMDNDFKVGTGDTRTLRARILQLESVAAIRVCDRMPANNVVLVQLSMNVVDLAIAQSITAVDWTEDGTFKNNHRVYAAWAPRVKSTHGSKCGVAHLAA